MRRPRPLSGLKRVASIAAFVLLTVSLLLGLLIFATSTLPMLIGFKPMVVSSSSMHPQIQTGDVVLIKKLASETSIKIGDVITYANVSGPVITTHRVIAIAQIQGRTYFQTQGDANATPDPNLTPMEAILGKVKLNLPKAGYLLYFSASPLGRFIILVVPLSILLVREVASLRQPKRPQRSQPPVPSPDKNA